VLKGRLGLDKARIPYADRHGLLWLDRGRLSVEDGCLRFITKGGALADGDYQIPHQALSMILLGPGSSVTHDALRLLANHGTGLVAVGQDGVRTYTAPPLGAGDSALARQQATLWGNKDSRISVARKMYALRMGSVLPHRDLDVLRGIEGGRVKKSYQEAAERFGIAWAGRHYDRANPARTDVPNQAINHAASAVSGAAAIAVIATAAIPQLGFIHEDSSQAFVLDIADLFRETATLEIAFGAAKEVSQSARTIDYLVRQRAAALFAEKKMIPSMIDKIKSILTPSDDL
jgi:CRISP-associated protein Cas1